MRNFCKIWWKCRKYYEWRHKKSLNPSLFRGFLSHFSRHPFFWTYFYDVTHDTFCISKFNLVWYNIYPFLSSNRMFVGPVKYLELLNSSISKKVWYWCLLGCFRLFMGAFFFTLHSFYHATDFNHYHSHWTLRYLKKAPFLIPAGL